jgi:hypothetical protein
VGPKNRSGRGGEEKNSQPALYSFVGVILLNRYHFQNI